jgi:hypothetical protein
MILNKKIKIIEIKTRKASLFYKLETNKNN